MKPILNSHLITAVNTGCGKTFITAGLVKACSDLGWRAGVVKPLLSGFDENNIDQCDTAILLKACQKKVSIDEINTITPWRYRAPLSIDHAAQLEKKNLPKMADLVEWCHIKNDPKQHHIFFIETLGGIMSPIAEKETVRDWAKKQNYALTLITTTALGMISQTLCSLSALREIGLTPKLIIINEIQKMVSLEQMTETLQKHHPELLFLTLPQGGDFKTLLPFYL